MSIWRKELRERHALHLARVCWALSVVSALLALAVLVFIPEISVLSQPDGTKYLYINRDFDLPTDDPATFSDYSLMPLCCVVTACSVFYLLTGAFFWGRQASLQVQRTPGSRFCCGPDVIAAAPLT